MERPKRSWGTGPTTMAGKRRAARNAAKHGSWSQPIVWVSRYADAVLRALRQQGEKFPGTENF